MRNLINPIALNQLKEQLSKDFLEGYLDRCVENAKDACPVDTGALRNSIHAEMFEAGEGAIVAGGQSETDEGESRLVDYAEDNEFNNPRRRGFLRGCPPGI